MIAIIGAGLAGLTAGKVLNDNGVDFVLYEKTSSLGGRVRSFSKGDFILDDGFQVLLTSYPQVRKHLKIDDLDLKYFRPGAEIILDKGITSIISDPFRDPTRALQTLLSPVGSFSDKLAILKLRFLRKTSKSTTQELLKSSGISEEMIESFFRPFFSGVFLEKTLETAPDFFLFIYHQFSKGLAALPKGGMQTIPKQLSRNYSDKICLSKEVITLSSSNEVCFHDGEKKHFSHIILATPPQVTNKLVPGFSLNEGFRSATTYYFSIPKQREKNNYLYLNGQRKGHVNHIAFLSSVQESYASDDKDLVSVNCIGPGPTHDEILHEIANWELFETSKWEFIEKIEVKKALPIGYLNGNLLLDSNSLSIAGDFTETPSIEGAMLSGEKAANRAMATLDKTQTYQKSS